MNKTILLFSYEFKPDLGGTAELAYRIAETLQRRGWRVIVLAREGVSPEADVDVPFEVIRAIPPGRDGMWHGVDGLRAIFQVRSRLNQIVRERNVAYVLSTETLRLRLLSGLLLSKVFGATGKPTGTVLHGMDIVMAPVMSAHRRWMFRRALLNLGDHFCNSQFTAKELSHWLGEQVSPVTIGCGITPDMLPPARERSDARKTLGLASGPVLLTIGRLVARKGVDMTIRAMPEILRRFPGTTYIVAGGGPDLVRLKALARECGCAQEVRFEGTFDNDLLATYYCASDIFLMPSRLIPGRSVEGFGIVFAEAGHYGVPVIGGRAGGVPDAIIDGETGLLVDPEDPADIARAVILLLSDQPLRARMGEAGKQHADNELTWNAVTERLEKPILERLGA